METFVLNLYDYLSQFTTTQLIVICVLLIIATIALYALAALTDNGIKFGTYKVKVKDNNNEQIVTVKAWNEVNAVEKAKRIGKTDGIIFQVLKD